jgi:thiol-disulfide isomerase/thioredoxin
LPPGVAGILAGRVLDSYERQPPPTYIRVVSADGQLTKEAPIEVATDSHGYFTIHNLRPGQPYQLIARTREGEAVKLAGSTLATPPNPRVLIRISADLATPNTPAAPAPPVVPGQKPSQGTGTQEGSERTGSPSSQTGGTGSIPSGEAPRGADLGTPSRTNEAAPNQGPPPHTIPAAPRTNIRMQDIADRPDDQTKRTPILNIPPQAGIGRPVIPQDSGPEPPSGPATVPAPAAEVMPRVPSCVLTGRQLDNFALYDLNGQPWEFRKHRGRVVLIDFWGTWCRHCWDAIPHLNNLHKDYGPNGLEIIGITYEGEGSLQEQILRVKHFRDHVGINYRLLLGGPEATCPVKAQFEVHGFPTLVLLDANNRIIWRSEGLSASKLQDLKIRIAQQLGLP